MSTVCLPALPGTSRLASSPRCSYCDWQPHYIQLDPEIGDQIEAYLHGEENLWVVTSADAVEPERIAALLQREYTCVDTQGQYRLWKK